MLLYRILLSAANETSDLTVAEMSESIESLIDIMFPIASSILVLLLMIRFVQFATGITNRGYSSYDYSYSDNDSSDDSESDEEEEYSEDEEEYSEDEEREIEEFEDAIRAQLTSDDFVTYQSREVEELKKKYDEEEKHEESSEANNDAPVKVSVGIGYNNPTFRFYHISIENFVQAVYLPEDSEETISISVGIFHKDNLPSQEVLWMLAEKRVEDNKKLTLEYSQQNYEFCNRLHQECVDRILKERSEGKQTDLLKIRSYIQLQYQKYLSLPETTMEEIFGRVLDTLDKNVISENANV